MTVSIRELDPTDPAAVPALLPLFQAAMAADAPLWPEPTEAVARWHFAPFSVRHRMCVVAHDAGSGLPLGYGLLQHDNAVSRDLVYGDIWIRPGDRAETTVPLLDAFRDHARRRGASRFVLAVSEHAAADYEPRFAAEGGRKVSDEFRSQLDLRAIDREQYAAWAAPSAKNAHYRIESWTAPTPEELLAPLVTALDAMRDAPSGELNIEVPPPSTDRRRTVEADIVRSGTRMYFVAARTEDGEIAGMHETLVVGDYRLADVGHTAVQARFRGHGLGLRLKAILTLSLLEREPAVDAVSTWNDSENAPMLRVNDALGYVRADAWSNWQFDL